MPVVPKADNNITIDSNTMSIATKSCIIIALIIASILWTDNARWGSKLHAGMLGLLLEENEITPLVCGNASARAALSAVTLAALANLGSIGNTPCVIYHALEGRTGNQIVNYFVLRLYGEIHGCAMQPVLSFGGDAGGETTDFSTTTNAAQTWPPDKSLPARDAAWVAMSMGLRPLFDGGTARALALGMQFERADLLYSAASLGWVLGGGGTLAGRSRDGRGPVLLSDEAVASRCHTWAAQREGCWADRSGAALHPWLPAGVRRLALAVLAGEIPNDAPSGLRALAADPEHTLVVHARLGDMSAMAWQEVKDAARNGHAGVWGDDLTGGVGWEWSPERFPHYHYPEYPDCVKLRDEDAYNADHGADMIEALESDAARLGGFTVSPLSFYEHIFNSQKPHTIVVLTESCSVDHPIIRKLVQDYGAIVQTGTIAQDMATLVLARQVVISSSTFSFISALMGRAKVVHVPFGGAFSLTHSHNMQCLTPSTALDARFVYHDVYRRAVDSIAKTLSGEGSNYVWRTHSAQRSGPLPQRPSQCPQLRTDSLKFDDLANFYRNPACARYYYPPVDMVEAAARAEYETRKGKAPICTDTEWTFFKNADP